MWHALRDRNEELTMASGVATTGMSISPSGSSESLANLGKSKVLSMVHSTWTEWNMCWWVWEWTVHRRVFCCLLHLSWNLLRTANSKRSCCVHLTAMMRYVPLAVQIPWILNSSNTENYLRKSALNWNIFSWSFVWKQDTDRFIVIGRRHNEILQHWLNVRISWDVTMDADQSDMERSHADPWFC